ncbi:MAG: hypothetical protein HYY40_02940 [Bacteroidetes bacterium]|nr:hypothetical protein [Bacteroidota bacterium]
MNPFSNYALYYDLLYSDKDYNAESIYIDGLLKKYAPAAKNLLSLGCGTGKHEVILARNGFSVTGIDRSG